MAQAEEKDALLRGVPACGCCGSEADAASSVPYRNYVRPSWDNYFMQIADAVATRSTCLRRHVGAVLVADKRILATGYNGVPAGIAHCSKVGCLRERLGIPSGERHELCRGLHAEQNTLIQAARHGGIATDGSTVYCTAHPCAQCLHRGFSRPLTKLHAGGFLSFCREQSSDINSFFIRFYPRICGLSVRN